MNGLVWKRVRLHPSTSIAGVIIHDDISSCSKDDLAKCNWNSGGVHTIFMAIFSKEF